MRSILAEVPVKLSRILFALAVPCACSVLALGCTSTAQKDDSEWFQKGPPPNPCATPEDTSLGLEEPTALGASATELVGALLPIDTKPLFWVPYNDYFKAAFVPGVSETRVTLGLSLREGEAAVEHDFAPVPGTADPSCGASKLEVPVSITLKTEDGALDEQMDATLEFFSPITAGLSVFLPVAGIAGSFAVTGGVSADLEFLGLYLGISLWHGGSRGSLAPEFGERGSSRAPEPGSAGAQPVPNESLTPGVPQHWFLFGVWPHHEGCQGSVYDLDEQLAGWSPSGAVQAVTSSGAGALRTADASTPVHFTLEPPSGLVCVHWNERQPADFGLRMPGRLKADAAAPESVLQPLDAVSDFDLTGHVSELDGALDSVEWRRPRQIYPVAESQPDFIADTGLHLAAADTEQQFLWSWQGSSTRASSGDWSTTATFTVQSARAKQTQECESMVLPPPGTPQTATAAPMCTTIDFSELGDTVVGAKFER